MLSSFPAALNSTSAISNPSSTQAPTSTSTIRKEVASSPARFPSAPFCLLRPPLHQCSHFLLPFLIASCCSRGILAPLIIRLNFLTIIAVITEHALSIGNQTWVGVTRFFSFYLHSFYTYLHLLPFCLLPT